jgi:hypothetical protein
MKILRIVVLLAIYFIITFSWQLYNYRNVLGKFIGRNPVREILQLPAMWVLPIVMIVVGIFFGLLYSLFRKTKNRSFILGQATCLAISALLFLYKFIADWQHEKQFGNLEYNRSARADTFFPADTSYQIKAFDALEGNFSDKNSFRITDLFSDNKDTMINSVLTQVHISWYEYYLNKDPKRILCAKYLVFNDTITTEYVNSDVTKQVDFKVRKMYKDSLLEFAKSVIN